MTLLVILWVLCAGFSALIGAHKGRSVGAFFMYGLLFGVLGLAYAAFASTGEELDRLSSQNPR